MPEGARRATQRLGLAAVPGGFAPLPAAKVPVIGTHGVATNRTKLDGRRNQPGGGASRDGWRPGQAVPGRPDLQAVPFIAAPVPLPRVATGRAGKASQQTVSQRGMIPGTSGKGAGKGSEIVAKAPHRGGARMEGFRQS